MSQVTVCKWRARFVRQRLDGLYDEPRPGAPRRISDEMAFAIVLSAAIKERKLLNSLPAGYLERWSVLLNAGEASAHENEGPVEPLTERERSVLTLLSAGLRNEDISDRLCIALSTTKWHIKNIFAKLGVACRTEALVRAKQLRLIN